MTQLHADGKHFQLLNEEIHACMDTDIELTGCMGQRYIASGLSGKHLRIHGIPGNALGAYADGCTVEVFGNAQDATGDTMNAGEIVIHGSCGDATGYAMRGGSILVEGNVGYRAGIHMKAYKDQIPVLVIGGEAGSFLGEYQAGGYIIVLGLHSAAQAPVGSFCSAGMHGGKLYIRTDAPLPADLPEQVTARDAIPGDLAEIRPYLERFCAVFAIPLSALLSSHFYVITPNTATPYKRLYVTN